MSAEYPSDLRHDEPPISLAGVPLYRTRVLYVPQRPALLPATPQDFLNRVTSYASRGPDKTKSKETLRPQTSVESLHTLAVANPTKLGAMHGPVRLAEVWGIDEGLWDRPWANLSGGEAQRIALSVAVGLEGAEVLLLDGMSLDYHGPYPPLLYSVPGDRADICIGRGDHGVGGNIPSRFGRQ